MIMVFFVVEVLGILTFPKIFYQSTSSIIEYSSGAGKSTALAMINDYFLIRQTADNTIQLYDIRKNLTFCFAITQNYNLNALNSIQFDIDDYNNSKMAVMKQSYLYFYNFDNNSGVISFRRINYLNIMKNTMYTHGVSKSIQLVKRFVLVLIYFSDLGNLILGCDHDSISSENAYRTDLYSNNIVFNRMKTCYPRNSTSIYYLTTIWINNYKFVIYRCSFPLACSKIYQYTVKKCPGSNPSITLTRSKKQVIYSQDCQLVLLKLSARYIISVNVNITKGSATFFSRLDISGINFIGMQVLDINNTFIAVFSDTFYRIYKNNNTNSTETGTLYDQTCQSGTYPQALQSILEENLTITMTQIYYSRDNNVLIGSSSNGLFVKNTFKCPSGSSFNRNCANTDVIIDNQATFYQSFGLQLTKFINKYITNTSKLIINILQIAPFSFLFLRFINFWSLCSLYFNIDIKIPNYLKSYLFIIFKGVNSSFFSLFGYELEISGFFEQKFSNQQIQVYGVSSDFTKSNFQSSLILFASYLVITFIYFLNKCLVSMKLMSKKTKFIEYSEAIFGQYISMMPNFFFSFFFISQKSYQHEFNQRLNLTLQNLFIIVSTFLSFAILTLKKTKYKNWVDRRQIWKQKLQWLFICVSNSIIPFIAFFTNVKIFLGVTLILYLVPLYTAFQQKQFKVSKIFLSLYIIFFHIGFIILHLIDSLTSVQTESYQIISLMTTIFLILGAIHQLFQYFFEILYFLGLYLIRDKLKKFLQKKKIKDQFRKQSYKRNRTKKNHKTIKQLIFWKNQKQKHQKKKNQKAINVINHFNFHRKNQQRKQFSALNYNPRNKFKVQKTINRLLQLKITQINIQKYLN